MVKRIFAGIVPRQAVGSIVLFGQVYLYRIVVNLYSINSSVSTLGQVFNFADCRADHILTDFIRRLATKKHSKKGSVAG